MYHGRPLFFPLEQYNISQVGLLMDLLFALLCVVDVDECASSPCENSGVCIEADVAGAGFICQCEAPWTGTLCQGNHNIFIAAKLTVFVS